MVCRKILRKEIPRVVIPGESQAVLCLKSIDRSDAPIYKGIINGAALSPKITIAAITDTIRIYFPSFPLNLRLSVFSDRRGSLLTIRRERITVKIKSAGTEPVKELKRPDSE